MRLRLNHSSTPARVYGLDNYDKFEHHGFLQLRINYEGEIKEFIIDILIRHSVFLPT